MYTSLLNWRKRALVLATCAGIGAFTVAAPQAFADDAQLSPDAESSVSTQGVSTSETSPAPQASESEAGDTGASENSTTDLTSQENKSQDDGSTSPESNLGRQGTDEGQAAPVPSVYSNESNEPTLAQAEDFTVSFDRVNNTTQGKFTIQGLHALVESQVADTLELTASMSFDGQVTRQVSQAYNLAQLLNEPNNALFDFQDYGRFDLKFTFRKNTALVHEGTLNGVAVTADHYTISALNGTMPGVYFSLSLFGNDSLRNVGPVYTLFERAGIWDWDALPKTEDDKYGVYALPSIDKDLVSYQPATVAEQSAMFMERLKNLKAYIRTLRELNPNSSFDFWFGDNFNALAHMLVYSNQIPQSKYKIHLVSDGSLTYKLVSDTFNQADNTARLEQMRQVWAQAMQEEYETGKVSSAFSAIYASSHYPWAAVQADENIIWSVTRKKLFSTPADNNAMAELIKAHPRVTQFSVGNLLKENVKGNEAAEQSFKKLFNFNDNLFNDPDAANKKIMVLLGTWVINERDFEDYTRITQTFYGDDYVYYYKGHPATPTDMYPSKQDEERRLGLKDLDASLPAEFILFFNPSINLSGYMSTTFASVPQSQDRGIWAVSKADGTKSEDTKYMDFYATPLTDTADPAILALRIPGHKYFLVELSDTIIQERGCEFALWDSTDKKLNFYKRNALGQYELMGEKTAPDFDGQSSHRLAEGDYVLQSLVDGNRVLDVRGGSLDQGANVWSWEYNGTDGQIWHLSYDDQGFAHLQNKKSGKFLDAFGAIAQNGTNINQWDANSSNAQKWRLVFEPNGSVRLISAINEGFALDVFGASPDLGVNVQLWERNSSRAQQWRFLPLKPSFDASKQIELEEGYYKISASANPRLLVDLFNWSTDNHARLGLWEDNGGENQIFKLSRTSDGFYRIENAWSGKALDSAYGSPMPGTEVIQWDSQAQNNNQKWYLEGKNANKVSLVNVGTGLSLDITGAHIKKGTLLQGYTRNSSKAQDFRFVKVASPFEQLKKLAQNNRELLKDGIYEIASATNPMTNLDVERASHNAGATVQLWASNGQDNQFWKLSHDADGFIEFESLESGLVLDVYGGKIGEGVRVNQWVRNNTRGQKWIALKNPDNSVSFVSALSPSLRLDIPWGRAEAGNPLQIWRNTGSEAQHFVARKID